MPNQSVGSSKSQAQEDAALVAAFRGGDLRAFGTLYERHFEEIRNLIASKFSLDLSTEAEDVAQEVFLTVYERIHQQNPERNFRSWMFTIAVNKVKDLRKKKTHLRLLESDDPIDTSTGASPELNLDHRERAVRVTVAFTSLPEKHQRILELKYINGLPYKEIASIEGCTLAAVKMRAVHARRAFRAAFTND